MKKTNEIILIPGGGPFADTVRLLDKEITIDNDNAHWMAIAAMDQYGHLLTSLGLGKAAYRPEDAIRIFQGGTPVIFLPYFFLKENDPLPHSWDITSDSIAAYLTKIFKPDLFVLLKSTDLHKKISSTTSAEIASYGIVDKGFVKYCPVNTETWVINGKHPERLLNLIRGRDIIGTHIKKNSGR